MRIALDYDRTFTLDREFWAEVMDLAEARGHEVLCITCRRPSETITDMPCRIIYSSREPKVSVPEASGITIDVWIDDDPWSILHGKGVR